MNKLKLPYKVVKLSKETHYKLQVFKLKHGLISGEATIKYLLAQATNQNWE